MKKKEVSLQPGQSANVVSGFFNDDVILFHQLSKQYFVLNTVAASIWQFCDGTREVSEIIRLIQDEYNSPPEQIAADVSETVEGFTELGLIET